MEPLRSEVFGGKNFNQFTKLFDTKRISREEKELVSISSLNPPDKCQAKGHPSTTFRQSGPVEIIPSLFRSVSQMEPVRHQVTVLAKVGINYKVILTVMLVQFLLT